MMHSRTLLGIATACALAGCGERVALEDTGISVEIPHGFQLDTYDRGSSPELFFRLPFAENGLQAAYPEIEISLARGYSLEPMQPDEYLFSRRKDLRDKLLFGPVSTTVGGRPAVEVAIRSQIVASTIGGSGGGVDVVMHDIEFLHGTRYYVCRLTVYPHEYSRYVDDLRDFCETVQFSNAGGS